MGYSKARWRAETAIRLEIANPHLTDAEIASHIGLTPAGYAMLKMRPTYKTLKQQYTTGILSSVDVKIADDYSSLMERHRKQVPIALQKLYDLVGSRDEKIQMRAVEQVLNRDGRFAEVSRIGMATPDQGGFVGAADANVANNLIQALGTVTKGDSNVTATDSGTSTQTDPSASASSGQVPISTASNAGEDITGAESSTGA